MTLNTRMTKNWIASRGGSLLLGALILACAAATRPDGGPPAGDGQVVLGTFDSRAVAIAFVNSAGFEATMQELHTELDAAKAAGDSERVAQLEAKGPKIQARIHAQGFSTAPVTDILEHFRDQLPDIATEAGVDVIVSKWDIVHSGPKATAVDVTEALMAAIAPTEKGLKSAREIMSQDPVPMDELRLEH